MGAMFTKAQIAHDEKMRRAASEARRGTTMDDTYILRDIGGRADAIVTDTPEGATVIPLTTTDTRERVWLTKDLALNLNERLRDIRDELADIQSRFADVMREVRDMPGGQGIWDRVDAYPGVRLDRDMGAGLNADGWIGEVMDFLEDINDAEVDYE